MVQLVELFAPLQDVPIETLKIVRFDTLAHHAHDMSRTRIITSLQRRVYSLRFKMSVALAKKNCFKMNVTLHFQYNFNFFLPTLSSMNALTFLSHNSQCNFIFVFFLSILVKVLCLMIISFDFLIRVQLAKTTLILKQMEYILTFQMRYV